MIYLEIDRQVNTTCYYEEDYSICHHRRCSVVAAGIITQHVVNSKATEVSQAFIVKEGTMVTSLLYYVDRTLSCLRRSHLHRVLSSALKHQRPHLCGKGECNGPGPVPNVDRAHVLSPAKEVPPSNLSSTKV